MHMETDAGAGWGLPPGFANLVMLNNTERGMPSVPAEAPTTTSRQASARMLPELAGLLAGTLPALSEVVVCWRCPVLGEGISQASVTTAALAGQARAALENFVPGGHPQQLEDAWGDADTRIAIVAQPSQAMGKPGGWAITTTSGGAMRRHRSRCGGRRRGRVAPGGETNRRRRLTT